MSTTVSAAVWKTSTAKGTALLLLVSLADQANDEGWCWPTVKLIAERCRVSERTVQRILIQLEEAGELIREERHGSSTRYQVTPRGDIAMSPPTERHPRHSYVTRGVTTVSPRNINEPSIDKDSLRSSLSRATPKRGTRLDPDWIPAPELIAQMRGECPTVDLKAEHLKFVDYWVAKAGQGATKLDWSATWRNWIRNAKPSNGRRLTRQEESDQQFQRMFAHARERDQAMEAQAQKEIET